MKPLFLIRLALDFAAAGLLVAAFAYDLTGNLVHEILGSAMFALLIGHNLFNRRWYGAIAKGGFNPQTLASKGVNLSLLVSMLALLVTSVIISQTVLSFLPLASNVSARQIHTMAGYLGLLIVGLHLGLHWIMIMGVARRLLRITGQSSLRTTILRLLATAIATYGVQSLVTVNIGSKLLMQFSLETLAFQSDPAPLLSRHAAILVLGATLGHYSVRFLRGVNR